MYALSDIVLRQNITENQYKLVLINVILILLKSEVRSFYYERVEMKSVSDVLKCLKGKKDSAAKLPLYSTVVKILPSIPAKPCSAQLSGVPEE